MRAVITLDDQDGQVGMTLFLEGGYTEGSEAHKTANMIVKFLDEQASLTNNGEATWVEGAEADWIKSDVVAVPEYNDTQRRVAALGDIATKSMIEIAK